jgi:hypothetical protein
MDFRFQWFIQKILDKMKIAPKFYGNVTISFQSGKPTHIKFEETEKYEDS